MHLNSVLKMYMQEEKFFSKKFANKFSPKFSSKKWEEIARRTSIQIFNDAIISVKGYRNFLERNRIKVRKITHWDQFISIPPVSKKNYLAKYPLPDRCKKDSFNKLQIYTSTSGSTGRAFYFCRDGELDWQYSLLAENFLQQNTQGRKNVPTLVIICFGLGVWIGGLITYRAFEIAIQRAKSATSIIAPGVNKDQIFEALKNLAPYFSQVILVGYPPFIKDIIDESKERGINLKKIKLRLLFAAEGFSELFRNYLNKHTNIENLYNDTLNIYGSAELGAMAWETGLSILIKELALEDQDLLEQLFNIGSATGKIPTLAQYNPFFINFEEKNSRLLITGKNSLPLIRYDIGDQGGVLSFDYILETFRNKGINLLALAKKKRINKIEKFPFVYVYERVDLSTKLYGAIIYPEHIKLALQKKEFEGSLTGKFTAVVRFRKNQDQYLEINVELKRNVKKSLSLLKQIKNQIVSELLTKNDEYRNNYNALKHRVIPTIILWNYGSTSYFQVGVKQKWVKR